MVNLTGLDLVKWDDDRLEEVNMLFSQWNSKPADDTSQDVQKFSSTVKFVIFVDKGVEAIGNCLSDHLSSWNKLYTQC